MKHCFVIIIIWQRAAQTDKENACIKTIWQYCRHNSNSSAFSVCMQKFPENFFLSQRLIIEDEVFVGRFDKPPLNNLCLLNGDVLFPSSIVSDEKSSHTSTRRISSLIPWLIFSQRLLHCVVFGISTLESYNQRFFPVWNRDLS